MAKRTDLKCPFCGSLIVSVSVCKDLVITCHECGASLLITKNDDGSCTVSAKPQKCVG